MRAEQDAERSINGAVGTVNARDWTRYGAFFGEDVQMRFPGAIGGASDRQARVQFVQGILSAFSDGQISAVQVFQDGDRGCCQFHFKGTNTGPLAAPDGSEAPPTGKVAEFPYCVVARFENGVIAEFDEYFDRLEMLSQLGLA